MEGEEGKGGGWGEGRARRLEVWGWMGLWALILLIQA